MDEIHATLTPLELLSQGVVTQEEYEQLLAAEEKASAMEAEMKEQQEQVQEKEQEGVLEEGIPQLDEKEDAEQKPTDEEEEEESVVADSVRRMSSWFLSGEEEGEQKGMESIAEGDDSKAGDEQQEL